MAENILENTWLFDLVGYLVSSGLGSGIHGVEDFTLFYERNGVPEIATAARQLAATLRQRRFRRVTTDEPEVIAAHSERRERGWAKLWLNHRISDIDRVRRSYVDCADVSWLEVEATSYDG